MAYRDNVSALAVKMGISNNPELNEDDLKISKIIFSVKADNPAGQNTSVRIWPSPMNMGERLFFQSYMTDQGSGDRIRFAENLPELRAKAQEYFAELWEANPEPGIRHLIDAIRNPEHILIEIIWKDNDYSTIRNPR